MGSLQRDGTWCSEEAAHLRGVTGPAFNHPSEGQHRHYARSEAAVSTNLTRIGDQARAHPDLVFTSLYPTLTAPGTSERRGEEQLWGISRSYGFWLSIHPLKCLDTWKSEIGLTDQI